MSKTEEQFWTLQIDLIISAGPRDAWDTDEKIIQALIDGFSRLERSQACAIVEWFWMLPNRTKPT